MPEFLNKKYWKLTLWQWGLILIAVIIALFNFGSVLNALINICLVIGLACVALGFISWFTNRPRMATKFGIAAAVVFLIMYILGKINGQ